MNRAMSRSFVPYQDTPETSEFARFVRPGLVRLLDGFRLGVHYHRGEGDALYWHGPKGETAVLDLVGGFGTGLFGHNHPELVAAFRKCLDEQLPIQAQGSVRGPAGELAARLSHIAGQDDGRSFVTTFASTGTEVVEAALKHARLEYDHRRTAEMRRLRIFANWARFDLTRGRLKLQEAFRQQALAVGVERAIPTESLTSVLVERACDALQTQPLSLALQGAFHGKTLGSLQITHADRHRHPWVGSATSFLHATDPEELERQLEAHTFTIHIPAWDADSGLRVESQKHSRLSAVVIEPLQGEGGIRLPNPENLRVLRKAADTHGFPLVMDEIQCGMGRTGTFFACSQTGVQGDYYLLAKALGGGLAKLGALLVDRRRYVEDFGVLHTSTFADDDLSCSLALTALDIVERDGGALMKDCRDKGQWLRGELLALQKLYPNWIADVRGQGLMLGIDFGTGHRPTSPMLAMLLDEDLLASFLAGHLLHEENIRVLPALSSGKVMRIEPSAFVTRSELARFVLAFERVLQKLENEDFVALGRFAFGEDPGAPTTLVRDEAWKRPTGEA